MAFKMRSGNKPGFKNMGSSPVKQTKFPNSPKAMERKRKKQEDFEPAYEGADYSKEQIAKMTEAEKIANIDGYEPKKKTKSPAKQVKDKSNDLKEYLISEKGFTPADADKMIADGAYTKKDIKPGFKRKIVKPKKSHESAHGQLSDAQKEYETDMKLYKKQSTGKGGYVKKKKKSPAKQVKDLRKGDKYVDLDKGADMPVKRSGFGPRKGNVPNPEMQGRDKSKPFTKKAMKDGNKSSYTITTKDGTRKGKGNWNNPHAVKSDAQKKVEAKRAEYAKMTDAQKKAAQEKANAKRKAFEATPEYKKRRAAADKKMKEANKNK
tara:strand:- start:341 stop:1303 length:963 start_codon:yes stop_codon:yes gene_type:complete